MARKRERFDIINDILKVVSEKGQIGPTRLLYSSNLSTRMFKTYIDELLMGELLIEIDGKGKKKTYSVTDNGLRYIEKYRMFSNLIDSFGL